MFTKDKAFYRSFFRLTVTLMLEQAVVLSVNLVDNLMLGTYAAAGASAEYALSGVAAVNQLQFVLQQLVYGISNGMIVLGSRYWGQKDLPSIRGCAAGAVRLSGGLVLCAFIAVSLFPTQILSIFSRHPMILEEGTRYLAIVRFSYLFFGVSVILTGTMRLAESVRIALIVSVISLILNCSINYVLIFGRFGAPEMGVRGAAIGTLTARIVEMFIVLWYVLRKDDRVKMRFRDFFRVEPELMRNLVRVTAPVVLAAAMWGVFNAIQTVILGQLNDVAIAAQSISNTIFLLLKVTSIGAASAAGILIGKALGENKGMSVIREYTNTLQMLFVVIGVVIGSIMLLLRGPLLAIYRISDETRSLANAYMIIQSAVLVTMSYQMSVNAGIIRGGGDSKFIIVLDFICCYCMSIPLSVLAAFVWHLSPVWVILLLNFDQFFKCIPAFIRVNSYHWVRRLTKGEMTTEERHRS